MKSWSGITQRQGLPMPKIYVIPTDSPNAFATGRNPSHASVAVTQGILNLLDDEELEGVLAHELGHVRNRDILISSIAATLAGAITILARMAYWGALFGGMGGRDREDRGGGGLGALFMLILAPFAAMLIQLAVSRSREYQADATGAHFTGNPYALARALQKLDAYSQADTHGRFAFERAPVHRAAAVGDELRRPVLDPSAHPQTHRALDRPAAGNAGVAAPTWHSVLGTLQLLWYCGTRFDSVDLVQSETA